MTVTPMQKAIREAQAEGCTLGDLTVLAMQVAAAVLDAGGVA
jgi:hypothetical protein